MKACWGPELAARPCASGDHYDRALMRVYGLILPDQSHTYPSDCSMAAAMAAVSCSGVQSFRSGSSGQTATQIVR